MRKKWCLRHSHTHTRRSISSIRRAQKTRFSATRIDHFWFVAPESARKIAAKNRSPMPTGIGGSFQLANSASPLGVIDSASAPTARMRSKVHLKIEHKLIRREKRARFTNVKQERRKTHNDNKTRYNTTYMTLTTSHFISTFYTLGLLGPKPCKNCESRMSEANPRQSLVKGERLIRYELASAIKQAKATKSRQILGCGQRSGRGNPSAIETKTRNTQRKHVQTRKSQTHIHATHNTNRKPKKPTHERHERTTHTTHLLRFRVFFYCSPEGVRAHAKSARAGHESSADLAS